MVIEMKNIIGKTIGGMLIALVTVLVWMCPTKEAIAPEDTSVRPIRSAVVQAGYEAPDLFFPARINAGATRTLSFKRAGRVASMPVVVGEHVKKGAVLATLEKESFENAVKIAEADLLRDKSAYDRRVVAAGKNAISKEELTTAEAQYRQSESRYNDAKLALEETVLVAPFDGIVSRTCTDELTNVGAGQPILVYHDISRIQVKVVAPETMIIRLGEISFADDPETFTISFDSAPGKSYPVKFKEFESSADENTQTFRATFEFPSPRELVLLPGMSGTLKMSGRHYSVDSHAEGVVTVPESAVGIQADGSQFVWVLTPEGTEGVFVSSARPVVIGARNCGRVRVESGLSVGERVATAGVAVLTEGRRVTLLGE